MNTQTLLNRILDGRLIIVGEFRNGRIQTSSAVDTESGEKIQKHEIVYAVECGATLGTVFVFRHLPPDADVTGIEIGLTKGGRYAFELDRFTRKGTGVTAWLGYREPESIEDSAQASVTGVRP